MDEELERLATLSASFTMAEILLFSCSTISDALLRDKSIVVIYFVHLYINFSIVTLVYISVLHWCLQNKFELVELEQMGDPEPDAEGNKFGTERIIEALHAHTWPNIILKGKTIRDKKI